MSYLNDPKNQVLKLQTDSGLAIRRNRRQNQTSYVNPLLDEETKFKMEQLDLQNKTKLIDKITSSDKAKAVLNNKFFWIFIGFAILAIILGCVIALVPPVHHCVCQSVDNTNEFENDCGNCLSCKFCNKC